MKCAQHQKNKIGINIKKSSIWMEDIKDQEPFLSPFFNLPEWGTQAHQQSRVQYSFSWSDCDTWGPEQEGTWASEKGFSQKGNCVTSQGIKSWRDIQTR